MYLDDRRRGRRRSLRGHILYLERLAFRGLDEGNTALKGHGETREQENMPSQIGETFEICDLKYHQDG